MKKKVIIVQLMVLTLFTALMGCKSKEEKAREEFKDAFIAAEGEEAYNELEEMANAIQNEYMEDVNGTAQTNEETSTKITTLDELLVYMEDSYLIAELLTNNDFSEYELEKRKNVTENNDLIITIPKNGRMDGSGIGISVTNNGCVLTTRQYLDVNITDACKLKETIGKYEIYVESNITDDDIEIKDGFLDDTTYYSITIHNTEIDKNICIYYQILSLLHGQEGKVKIDVVSEYFDSRLDNIIEQVKKWN